MMFNDRVWITGASRTGKTSRLVSLFQDWVTTGKLAHLSSVDGDDYTSILVLAANDDNRRILTEKLVNVTGGRYPLRTKTPLAFFQDEVNLFWSFLVEKLSLKAQFPVQLRPQSEQEFFFHLFADDLEINNLYNWILSPDKLIRKILDLWQLAASSGTSINNISTILSEGLVSPNLEENQRWIVIQLLLEKWRSWCLESGFLTYALSLDLYWQYLLPDPFYQQKLCQRYQGILADDLDDYPAIARDLFELLLQQDFPAIFTYNPDGAVKLGASSDPDYLSGLATSCRQEYLNSKPSIYIPEFYQDQLLESLNNLSGLNRLDGKVETIQKTSRSDLLRDTATTICKAIKNQLITPEEIAIIAPGLDAIAFYTLTEFFKQNHLDIHPLNYQRPLIVVAEIRALLTLLCLIYPGLGRLIDQDAVAEMLVILTNHQIDPVRAGLIADHCYIPDVENPQLLPASEYLRWDRLTYQGTTAYNHILQWINHKRSPANTQALPSWISLLDQAIQQFIWQGGNITYNKLSALRELMETAQHYQLVANRLPSLYREKNTPLGRLIQLLKKGTITANPYPIQKIGPEKAITLATIFQYRSARTAHKWHFWLDISSPLWLSSGSAGLFAANLFLKNASGSWTVQENLQREEQRLGQILRDLSARATEKIYLCHSELGTNGQEQTGPLLSLINTIQ